MIAQSGDLGVTGYVTQGFAEGAIGYVNYSYAIGAQLPGGQGAQRRRLLHRADAGERGRLAAQGRHQHRARATTTSPRTSTGSTPTPTPATTSSRRTRTWSCRPRSRASSTRPRAAPSAPSPTTPCARASSSRRRSATRPMPINLVNASFEQIRKVPGAEVQSINVADVRQPDVLARRTQPAGRERPVPVGVRQAGRHPVLVRQRRRQGPGDPDLGRRWPVAAPRPTDGAGAGDDRGHDRRPTARRPTPICDPDTGECTTDSGSASEKSSTELASATPTTLAGVERLELGPDPRRADRCTGPGAGVRARPSCGGTCRRTEDGSS